MRVETVKKLYHDDYTKMVDKEADDIGRIDKAQRIRSTYTYRKEQAEGRIDEWIATADQEDLEEPINLEDLADFVARCRSSKVWATFIGLAPEPQEESADVETHQ